MSDLSDIRVFLAVAKQRSFTAAARQLSMTAPSVTRAVGALSQAAIAEALEAGAAQAQRLLAGGLIAGAALHVQGGTRVVVPGNDAPLAAKHHVQAVRARETMDA